MTAPTFLGLTQTLGGVLAAWSDGRGGCRVAELIYGDDANGAHFRPLAHADYAALWPEPVTPEEMWCQTLLSSGYRCLRTREPGHKECAFHESLPTRAD